MILDKDTSKTIASELLKIAAVKFSHQNDCFTWSSGWLSPVYCDNRLIFSYVATRDFFKDLFVSTIEMQYPDTTLIAGVATGGIPMGTLVADALNLPFVYVRSSPKKHGRQNQVEGFVNSNDKVVVIEDLISTGKSSLRAITALRKKNTKILGLVSVFTYGFDVAVSNFKAEAVPFIALTDYLSLLEEAVAQGYVKSENTETLKKWREAPHLWRPTP